MYHRGGTTGYRTVMAVMAVMREIRLLVLAASLGSDACLIPSHQRGVR